MEVAVLSTEAGGFEAGRLRVWAGRGCVGSAILEDTFEAEPAFAEPLAVEEVVNPELPSLLPLLPELAAICWNLPKSKFCNK